MRFYERVFTAVSKIPEGYVATYGQIAMLIGMPRAARQVGTALAKREEFAILPCHRVVNRNGELSPPHIFGEGVQRELLLNEGIAFLPDGRIDLKKHLWKTNAL